MTLTTTTLETPIGKLRLVASEAGLRSVSFPGRTPPSDAVEGDSPVLGETARQLAEYFAGTPFQLDAWLGLAEIPYGETVSYGEQAARLGRPEAVRAVGAANGSNPLPIVLPCHRVIGADGSLTGFGGGLEVKRALLDHEAGVRPLFTA
jgi:methylated-DNA-[protein]-cysteine S-methyltransferase